MSLEGKHALISGGGSGIGAAIAGVLVKERAKVTLLGRREAPLKRVAEREGVGYQQADVTDPASLEVALNRARRERGPFAIVVANAGAAVSKPFTKMDDGDFSQMLAVNLEGVFHLWRAALPDLRERGWGRLMAVASTAGLKGYPYVSGYCAAKHGVVGLTRALALELAQSGITVNALCPGFVETPLLADSIATIIQKTGMSEEEASKSLKANNPQKRFIQVAEVASAALWLCREESAGINGHALALSGGEI